MDDDLVFEEVGFDGPKPPLAPFGGAYFLDRMRLDRTVGLELLEVGIENRLILFAESLARTMVAE